MRTKDLKNKVAEMQKVINTAELIKKAGIPAKYVDDMIVIPYGTSGYNMGEICNVYIGDELIYTWDRCEEYARSCSYSAQHGKVVIRMKKSQYRNLVEMFTKYYKSQDVKERCEYIRAFESLVEACVDRTDSYFKNGKINNGRFFAENINEF